MKKIIILIAALLAVSVLLVSCSKEEDKGTASPNNATVENQETVTPSEPEVTEPEVTEPEVTEPEATEPEATDKTAAKIMVDAFVELAKAEGATAESVATALSANENLPFMPMTMKMEAGYLPGFNEDISGFEDCYVVGPAIGSIPFVSYVFDLADDADVAAFVANLEALHNLRWNICVSADEMLTAVEGDLIYFIMSPLSFEQEPIPEEEGGLAL